jgi:two-component system, NarL family, nitrate/nitrite response regulator NarL
MSDVIRIVIVDDHPLFRQGVAASLSAEPDFEVVGQGASADDALTLVQDFLPDILLLDIALPGGGLKAAQEVASIYPVTKIVMLTFSESEDNVLEALRVGASGYILKGVSGDELERVIKAVYSGEVYVTPGLAAGLLRGLSRPSSQSVSPEQMLDKLTVRERQILELISAGHSNKVIGSKLDLAEKTVKHYITNILQKLQVQNRVKAALMAQQAHQTKQ